EDMITERTPEARAAVLARYRQARKTERYGPPSVEGTITFPGFNGGAEWGGAAIDPAKGIMYVNATELPWIMTMVGAPTENDDPATLGSRTYLLNCASCHGTDLAGDASGTFPDLQEVQTRYTRDQIEAIIDAGRGYMPSFAHIPDESKRAL